MNEYIIGIPKGKELKKDNVIEYINMQDAMSMTEECLSVYCNTFDEAKDKLLFIIFKKIMSEQPLIITNPLSQIKQLQIEIHKTSTEKGFWKDYDLIPINVYNKSSTEEIGLHESEWIREQHKCTKLALIITEIAEAIEARRKGKDADLTGKFPLGHEYYTQESKEWFENNIKDTEGDELADAFIRLLDYCEKMDIDLEWHVKEKMIYNNTRAKMHDKKY